MPKPQLVRVKLEDGTETSMGAEYAEAHGLTVLDKPATIHGRTIPAKYPVDLRGAELDAALEAAGLPKTGRADEKRERLAAHQEAVAVSGGPTPSGESAGSTTEESE